MAGTGILLCVTYTLISRYGLRATAIAQVAQNTTVLLIGWLLFVRNHSDKSRVWLPFLWDKATFRELVKFGAGLQAANLVNMLYEPGTKMVLSAVAGLEALGLFEIAQRLVQQGRQLVVMPTQTLIPAYIRASSSAAGTEKIYTSAFSMISLVGSGIMAGLILLSPIISSLF